MSLHRSLVKDVSPRAVKKSVASQAAQQPLTLYPGVIGALGAGFGLLISSTPWAWGVAAGGLVLTAGHWVWQYFVRGSHLAARHVARVRADIERRRRAALAQLHVDMREAGDQQGLKQIESFETKYQNFVEILSRKFSEDELTYQRYLTIAEQVFLGGLDNLEQAALSIKSVSAINPRHVDENIRRLENDGREASQQKLAELRARKTLRESQMLRADALLLENEKALTQLDHVSAKIAQIKTQQGRAQLDLEASMAELQHLITRADDYGN